MLALTARSAMARIVSGLPDKKSKRIEALTRHGYTRQEIADFLGIIYQHVRNEQVRLGLDYKKFQRGGKTAPASEPKASDHLRKMRLTLAADGRLIIPAAVRAAMGVEAGGELIARLQDGELRLATPETAVSLAQKRVQQAIPGEDSLAQSLIADRRLEAGREDRHG
jgi:bifunctional DNA-binding transcriptional regulator/antitoxin component of YhaV-PrlF toxin-antitoxin module